MNKQNGFSVVEVLLALLLVSFISFAGYYVWNSQQDSSDKTTPTNTPSTAQDSDSKTAGETAAWLTYESPDKAASIKLPDGYEFEKADDGLFLTALEEKMMYKKGTKATTGELFGRDAVYGLYINFDGESNMDPGARETATYKTDSGIPVSEYYQLYSQDSEGIGPSEGTKEYVFIAYKNDQKVVVRYSSVTANQLDTVKKMVKTISIK